MFIAMNRFKVISDSREEFERVRREVEETCDRNAHERCRRFMSAPLTQSLAEARRHVEGRSEDLRRRGRSWATRPTRCASSGGGHGRAGCFWTGGRS